jgi:hypothetical protein
MTAEAGSFRTQVLLSIQRALWDMVTPELRGLAVKHVSPLIELRFIYEAVAEEQRMIAEEVGTYVIADFSPPTDIRIETVAIAPGIRRSLEEGEEWVYRRREEQE